MVKAHTITLPDDISEKFRAEKSKSFLVARLLKAYFDTDSLKKPLTEEEKLKLEIEIKEKAQILEQSNKELKEKEKEAREIEEKTKTKEEIALNKRRVDFEEELGRKCTDKEFSLLLEIAPEGFKSFKEQDNFIREINNGP